MFRKVHMRLTLLFTLFAALILVVMSGLYLYINYRSLDKNSAASFRNDVYAFENSFDGNVVDLNSIKNIRKNYDHLVFIYDSGSPIHMTKMTMSESQLALAERVRKHYTENIRPINKERIPVFDYRDSGKDHYVGVYELDRDVQVYIICDLSLIAEQKRRLLIRFLLIDGAALIIFYLFSYFFTGRLLRPIDEAAKRQNEFIAAASHEIRNPVNTMMTALSAMEKAEPSQQGELISIAQKEGRRLARLTGDLLTLARGDAGSFKAEFGDAELDTIVLDCYEAFSLRAAEKGIDLKVELPEESVNVRADASRISQAISILLDNAISYTPKGGRVGLFLEKGAKNTTIKVTDNGEGIPDEYKEKIFERFYRADDARTDENHFGLGLCIAKELITLHGGTIEVSDTEGGGSTFIIRLGNS